MIKLWIEFYCVLAAYITKIGALLAFCIGMTLMALYLCKPYLWWFVAFSYLLTAGAIFTFVGNELADSIEREENN